MDAGGAAAGADRCGAAVVPGRNPAGVWHRAARDHVPAGKETPGLTTPCLHPISLHAIRHQAADYIPLWEALMVREATASR